MEEEIPKKIYVKSDWNPPIADPHVEDRMSNFQNAILAEHKFLRKNQKKASNLTHIQKSHISLLRSNRDFVILNADKNLGPAIMEREAYIKRVLGEHLLDKNTYENISNERAEIIFEKTKEKTLKLLHKYKKFLSKPEFDYFMRSLFKKQREPQFYGMPKVHKDKVPIPLRPVVSQCGSLFAILSIFVDFKLQPLTKFIPSYLNNSEALLDILDEFGPLPLSAKLFTSDATSMYSNIDPSEALPVLEDYLKRFGKELDNICVQQIELLIALTKLIMENNVFKFGSTWWRQKIGTAMGTSCACIYATIFFAYFERTLLLPKYKNNFMLFKRKIDDIFAIWIPDPSNPNAWNEFLEDLNSVSKLEWNTEELSNSVNFLDLTIYIDESTRMIKYKTYQKEMNLYLYIPNHSASPPGLLKSLVFGLLSTYKRQNSVDEDFKSIVCKLFERLVARGYARDTLNILFQEVAQKLDSFAYRKKEKTKQFIKKSKLEQMEDNLFFHLPFHPKSVSRSFIQEKYKQFCEKPDTQGESFRSMKNGNGGKMKIEKLTIAYSRAKNLRDLLSPSKLSEFEDCTVQQFL